MSYAIADAERVLLDPRSSILRVPTVRRATSAEQALVWAVAMRTVSSDVDAVIEPFDGGALVLVDLGTREVQAVLVGVVAASEIAAVHSADEVEADGLFALMAERLGVLSGICSGCGAAIACVYEVCRDCA